MAEVDFAKVERESNVEYVTRKVREMIANSDGGATVFTEVVRPKSGDELMGILIQSIAQIDRLVYERALGGGGTARLCLLMTLEGEERPEGAATQLPA